MAEPDPGERGTEVFPAVRWPTAEPDELTSHLDYLDTSDGPARLGPDGPTAPAPGPGPAAVPPGPPFDQTTPADPTPPWRSGRRLLLGAGIAIGALVLLYGVDLVLARGELPRGVTVAGVHLGGLERAAAEQRLRADLGPRLTRPIDVQAGDVQATVDPRQAGLTLDWAATLDRAGQQPLNPFTRVWSLFADREVGTATSTNQASLTSALRTLQERTDHPSSEGTIRFDGATPVPVDPRPGQTLDLPRARAALVAGWASGTRVELPVASIPVFSTAESVRTALDSYAKPAVAGPVKITGEGADATLSPAAIGAALTFEVGPDGTLSPKLDDQKVIEAARPQLAPTERPGKDAGVVIKDGKPAVVPAVDGRGVDWTKTLADLPTVLRGTDNRTLAAVYDHQPAKFTTEQATALGVTEVIGEFTTRGFATDSGVNIRTIAAEVNGALLRPGESFSLNGYTGPRGVAQGYVEAGIIEQGRPGRAVGGGCSQFATTLYNASYFAGMTDVTHREHSYYISRYPEAREATVFEGLIDLAFRNESPNGVLIETQWTPSTITVRLWGTKQYEVESITGGRSNYTSPNTVTIPFGEKCSATNGAQGFAVSNTRVLRDPRSGAEVKRTTRNVVYNPQPKIVCAPAPTSGAPPPG